MDSIPTSADDQRDKNKPRRQDQEAPMSTPDVSKRTGHAQYPMGDDIPENGERDLVASGWAAIYQTFKFAAKEGLSRSLKSLTVMNHKGGFDCPSCAWPEPDGTRHPAEFCENGAKAIAWEATNKTVGPDFFAKYSIDELAQKSERWLGDQGRISQPMVLRRGSQHYEPITWDDAFAMIAGELNALASPDEAMFYTSGRSSNEAAFVYSLFARQFGTNNLPDCSNMCHESSGRGLTESIGVGKGTVTLEDFDHADCIFVIGQNPGTNHPRMLTALEEAVKKGCKIISINPLKETGMIRFRHPQNVKDMLGPGTEIACLFLQVKINGDVAVLKGIMKAMLEMDDAGGQAIFDHDFIQSKTIGYEDFVLDLRTTPWDQIEQSSGVSRVQITHAATIAGNCKRMISCWAMGITQHKNGVANVRSIANLHLLRGQIGKQGAGVCPVRGHSNVQGDRTMGIWEQMSDKFLDALGKEFNFEPPRAHGLDSVAGLQAMHEGKVKAFVGLGGNFVSAMADTEYAAEAFRRLKLCVQISTKLNRNHLITGEEALILPCLGRTERDEQADGEQFVTTENSMSVVQSSTGILPPISQNLKSETNIICSLAHATLGGKSTVAWQNLTANYDRIRDHVEHVVPGFKDFNKRVRVKGGFYLPNAARDNQEFKTPSGKAHFAVCAIPKWDLKPDQLLLMSIRSHDQFNTTIYGENDRYRGIKNGRRVVFMNEADITSRNLSPGQWVNITSHFEDEKRSIEKLMVVSYDIPIGSAAMYYPEANPLVPLRNVAEGSNQPGSKSVVVTVEPS